MIDNNNLIKYFVRVPSGVSFNGAEVSNANATNQKKIYFDENTQQIWVKGVAFSLDVDNRTALATLIGEDTNKLVRTIAGEVINTALGVADANTVIDTLNEVLTWFHNLPEGDAGALALVTKVGNPAVAAQDAVLYADYEEYNAAKGTELTAEQFAELSDAEKTKTPAVEAQAATGLYKVIEDAVAGVDLTDYATKQHVEDRLGALGNATEAEGNTPAVPHTAKSYVDSKIGNLGNKVEAAAAVYYTQEEADAYNTEHSLSSGDEGFVTTETIKTPAITAVPYTNVMEVIEDNELTTAAAINDLNTRVEVLSGGGLTGVSIGDINATVTDNVAYITKAALQEELFANTYVSDALSYTYLGVTVSLKESNGELTYLNVNPTELVSRISNVEDFDPWEEYSAPVQEP